MKNQPKEIQNTTADPAPSTNIETFVQSVWAKPTDTSTNQKINCNPIENSTQQQVKVTGDGTDKIQPSTPQVMTKPIEQNDQKKEEKPTLAKETQGPKDKPNFPSPPLLNNGEKSILTKDAPPPTDAEEPSDASLDAALATVADSKASDTAKTVASAILKGDVGDIQDVLQDLEKDPDGKKKLQELAGELGDLLGTRVNAKAGEDGKFGLSFLTQLSSTPIYEFEHGPGEPPRDRINSSTTLSIDSVGATALQSISSARGFSDPATRPLDATTEATRLQAIGVRAVNNRPAATKPIGDRGGFNGPIEGPTTGTGIPGGRPDLSKPIKGPVKRYESDTLEVPPFKW